MVQDRYGCAELRGKINEDKENRLTSRRFSDPQADLARIRKL